MSIGNFFGNFKQVPGWLCSLYNCGFNSCKKTATPTPDWETKQNRTVAPTGRGQQRTRCLGRPACPCAPLTQLPVSWQVPWSSSWHRHFWTLALALPPVEVLTVAPDGFGVYTTVSCDPKSVSSARLAWLLQTVLSKQSASTHRAGRLGQVPLGISTPLLLSHSHAWVNK
jgi:hypothetical protein